MSPWMQPYATANRRWMSNAIPIARMPASDSGGAAPKAWIVAGMSVFLAQVRPASDSICTICDPRACPAISSACYRVCLDRSPPRRRYIGPAALPAEGALTMSRPSKIIALVAVAAIAVAAYLWLPVPNAPVAVTPAALPASGPTVAASAPAHYPVDDSAGPPLAEGDIPAALAELLGRKALAAFVQTGDFPRRMVATVDNLGRAHAPALLWPVNPTPGKFAVREADGSSFIADENSERYLPFVVAAESVDMAPAARLYQRLYPLLQRTYQALGYPRGDFNDRLVAVIDLLLATPQPKEPLQVQLVEVKGSVPSDRPWVRYEFADPALESLAAGQKILLRMGPANERRIKAKLGELRQALTR